jgi:hypothetical protein
MIKNMPFAARFYVVAILLSLIFAPFSINDGKARIFRPILWKAEVHKNPAAYARLEAEYAAWVSVPENAAKNINIANYAGMADTAWGPPGAVRTHSLEVTTPQLDMPALLLFWGGCSIILLVVIKVAVPSMAGKARDGNL